MLINLKTISGMPTEVGEYLRHEWKYVVGKGAGRMARKYRRFLPLVSYRSKPRYGASENTINSGHGSESGHKHRAGISRGMQQFNVDKYRCKITFQWSVLSYVTMPAFEDYYSTFIFVSKSFRQALIVACWIHRLTRCCAWAMTATLRSTFI